MAEFGYLKYVCVMIDTFSHAMVASAFAGETTASADATANAIHRFRHAFSILGVPSHTKMVNGLAYVLQNLQTFLCAWGIDHSPIGGIPHAPTGQAITERAHEMSGSKIKRQKAKGATSSETVVVYL